MKIWGWRVRGAEKETQREKKKVKERRQSIQKRRTHIRKNISLGSNSSLERAGATLLGNRMYCFLYRKSLFKLIWNLKKKKKIRGRKEKSNIIFLLTFKLLFRSYFILPSHPPKVFFRMEFSCSHSRIWRGQSTADAAELRNQESDSFFPWILCYRLDWDQANVKGCKSER